MTNIVKNPEKTASEHLKNIRENLLKSKITKDRNKVRGSISFYKKPENSDKKEILNLEHEKYIEEKPIQKIVFEDFRASPQNIKKLIFCFKILLDAKNNPHNYFGENIKKIAQMELRLINLLDKFETETKFDHVFIGTNLK